jgi:hypothetical protein
MALDLKPEQEKALLSLIDREIALPRLIQAREDAAKVSAVEVKP